MSHRFPLALAAAAALLLALASPPAARAADFVRGDANSDGAASIADSHFILSFLFRGTTDPECWKTADVDDSSRIDISDAVKLLNALFLSGSPVCPPHPEAGADPTADDLACDAYGGGSPIVDPAARLEVSGGAVDAAGKARITVQLSSSTAIGGYSGVISVEGGILAAGRTAEDVTDLSGTFTNGFKMARVSGGKLHFAFLSALTEPSPIPAGNGIDALELTVCLAAGAAPGSYALALESGELVDDATGRSIAPALAGGTLEVPAGLPAGAGCAPAEERAAPASCGSSPQPPPPPPPPPGPPPPPPPPPGPDVDFIRGDANSDGAVSVSDAHFVLAYLFIGSAEPRCLESGDVDDDGTVNISDPIRLLNHLALGGAPPCAPFPSAGSDRSEDSVPCSEYGGGEPLEDPAARMTASAVSRPGGKVEIAIAITNSTPIAGYSGILSIEGGLLAEGGMPGATDLSGAFARGFMGGKVIGGKLHFAFLASLTEPRAIEPQESIAVLELSACLAAGTAAGSYACTLEAGELVDQATGRAIHPSLGGSTLLLQSDLAAGDGCEDVVVPPPGDGCAAPPPPPGPPGPPPPPPPPPGPDVDFFRGDANADGRISISDAVMVRRFLFIGDRAPECEDSADVNDDGRLNITDVVFTLSLLFLGGASPPAPGDAVGPDPTPDALACPRYQVEPPAETEDLVRLGAVSGAPGDDVEVPVFLTNSVFVEAFQLVIRYPEEFIPVSGFDGLSFDGTFYEDVALEPAFGAINPDAGGGILTVGFVPNLIEGHETPPGQDRLIFRIRGAIAADAEPGTEVLLEPTNGEGGEGVGPNRMRNELTHRGSARFFSTIPKLEGAVLGIVGDQTFFLRGDSDGDARVNVTDAVRTLGALFLGTWSLDCEDAADANDDGTVDVTDPIHTLNYLFLRGAPIPAPHPGAGLDPTGDALGCLRSR